MVEDNQMMSTITIFGEIIEQFSQWGKLSTENLQNLKTIQKIILFEEGQSITLDEALSRVLQFYGSIVPLRS